MAINAQSGVGRIRLFEDFHSVQCPIALTTDFENLGDFYIGGEGIEDNSSGLATLDSDGLSGVGQMTSGATDNDTVAIMTGIGFDVALMGTLVLETRTRFADLDTKMAFIGFTSSADLDTQMTDILDYSAATTVTLTGATFCGFFLSSEFTDDEEWHMVYKGGTTTGATDTTTIDANDDAVAGEFQVLRLEVDNNGTARYYIDGVLKQTTAGAISTTTDLAAYVGVAANSAAASVMDVDYVLVE